MVLTVAELRELLSSLRAKRTAAVCMEDRVRLDVDIDHVECQIADKIGRWFG